MMVARLSRHERTLLRRLPDRRGGTVVFLSHCLLNENTRYLGGACRAGCVAGLVQQCLDDGIGIVQLPCPEQQAWGGVLKRRLLFTYGLKQRRPILYRLRHLLLPLALMYTRLVYRRMARAVAHEVADYRDSGFRVLGVVGVDGSPSCGVATTLGMRDVEGLLSLSPDDVTVDRMNAWVRDHATPGSGIFIDELRTQLARRRLAVPFLAHDLLAELDGKPTTVKLGTGE